MPTYSERDLLLKRILLSSQLSIGILYPSTHSYLILRSFPQFMGNTLSCCNLPTTIPGAIPIRAANLRICSSVGLKADARKLDNSFGGINISRAIEGILLLPKKCLVNLYFQ